MLTEDYFMRMINQALYVLKKVLGLKTTGHTQEALVEIEQALELLVGMRAGLLKQIDDQNILDALSPQGNLDLDRLYVVAELYRQEGEILSASGRTEEGLLSSLRALNFYLEVALHKGEGQFPPPNDQIAELVQTLKEVKLPAESLYPLFCYYEDQGKFDQAQSALILMASDPELEDETRQEQFAFYHRLMEKSEQELGKGGVRREEVAGWLQAVEGKTP